MAANRTVAVLLSLLFKYSIALAAYSGMGAAPMFGDFEAQRHWLEITWNVPPSRWYYYDLSYWGLDYPPLTAYHSWALAALAHWLDPLVRQLDPAVRLASYFALDTSRGMEALPLKLYMRATSLLTDLLVFTPAIAAYCSASCLPALDESQRRKLFLLCLLLPAFSIIDHGHFQYNSAMLGFALGAFASFVRERHVLGSVLFVASLGFKQMALFYALPVFFYLLGVCWKRRWRNGLLLLTRIGASVLASFALLLLPFLGDAKQLGQVFHRVFPIARGLYEDKVANVWCALSVIVKIRSLFPLDQLVKISIASVLLAVLPACVYLLRHPQKDKFMVAAAISSLGFFLFSFQVHEKSILLPLLPITLLYHSNPLLVSWFHNVALFSMWPLLKKDGLALPYVASFLLWNVLTHDAWNTSSLGESLLVAASYAGFVVLHVAEWCIKPPGHLPDLFVVLNVLLSTGLFAIMFAYLYRLLLSATVRPKQKAD
ncbi:Glucosyltransferase-like protein [Kappamyces sp. JEL0829]|nr:Glucosyltransferase-like protein [Kappamyces sp. JEL0829]